MRTQILEQHPDRDARGQPSDGHLLQRFINNGDQEAFALLMKRHGPYILGVCRHVTLHAQDAEDAFQACFLELVRNPQSICQQNSVAGWLQTVAVRMAQKAKARRARQRQKEVTGVAREAIVDADDVSWREVRQILHEEIAQLPEELRSVIVVCLFEGRTQEEAAQFLELNPRTVKDRLKRGRELLRGRLTRRGVTLAVMGALLSGGAVQAAVSGALHQATLKGVAALVNKAALAGTVSPAVLGLTGTSSVIGSWTLIGMWVAGLAIVSSAAVVVWEKAASVRMQTVQRTFRGGQFDREFFRWEGPRAEKFAHFE